MNRVNEQVSIAKWGLLALPNDIRKRRKFTNWMHENPEKVKIASSQMREDGLFL